MKRSLADLDHINSIPIPSMVIDVDTFEIVLFNIYFVHFFGYSNDEFEKLNLEDLFVESEFDRFRRNIRESRKTKGLQHIGEYIHFSNVKKQLFTDISVSLIEVEGKYLAIIYLNDISDNKRLRVELKRSNERFSSISSISKIGYWKNDLSTGKLSWTEEIYKIWEKPNINERVSYDSFKATIHPDDLKGFHIAEEQLFSEQRVLDFKHRIVLPEGKIKWVHELGRLTYDSDGNAIAIEGTVQDITERKENSLALQSANERFDKVTEATSDAIWDWDFTEDILFWGKGYKKVFGYDSEKVDPKLDSWKKNIHPEDIEHVISHLNTKLASKDDLWEVEYRYQKKNGSYAFVLDRGLIMRDKSNKPIRMIGAMRDITKKKQQEVQVFQLNKRLAKYTRELERSNEELNSFAFITSHDLQEPLRTISSFMNLLKSKYEDQLDEKALQYISFATDGSKRLKKMISGLLDYSRIGRDSQLIEVVDFNEVLNDYVLLRHKMIEQSSAQLNFENLPIIECYKAGVVQVLHALLDNAVKYSREHEKPVVNIKVDELTEFWQFSIKDNGIGIDPGYFKKVFEVFQRLHDKSEYPGTGIGLSIARRQVENMGGKIWIDSATDEGAKFYFTLPKIINA